MISKTMAKALNKQINAELYSAYLYLSMAAYAESINMKGVANWFSVQAMEETSHARKFYDYLNSVGERILLDAIAKPPTEFKSVKALFEGGLAHEKKVTKMINDLASRAVTEKDHATQIFLQWFVTEQIEEEENATDILAKLKLAGDRGNALFMIDRELGGRTFKPAGSGE